MSSTGAAYFPLGTDWNLYPLSSIHRLVWHIFEESFDESYIPEYAAILQQHRRLGENPVDVLRSFEVMQESKTVAVEQNKAKRSSKLCWSSLAGLKESLSRRPDSSRLRLDCNIDHQNMCLVITQYERILNESKLEWFNLHTVDCSIVQEIYPFFVFLPQRPASLGDLSFFPGSIPRKD